MKRERQVGMGCWQRRVNSSTEACEAVLLWRRDSASLRTTGRLIGFVSE
ncbi:hypothetical protein SynNOUM97013_02249 [Synechococcus sp. NOUM97013]|nr:hypothetical protein SynNOUM97013_02249 [Synechococcus sp. NOUM97013]